jgi:trimethylamine--corrinoid protein Co-methyltransferase
MKPSFAPFRYLQDQDMAQIEETSFRILEEIGVSLDHVRAREMLQDRGCRVENDRTFIPREAATWGVQNVTPYKGFRCVDGTPSFTLGDGCFRVHNTAGLAYITDMNTGRRRKATTQDVVDSVTLLDALENVDIIMPTFGPQDVPAELITLVPTQVTLANTNKPVICTGIEKPEHVPYVIEMAAACCGGLEPFRKDPTIVIPVSPVSPLTFSRDGTEAIIVAVESGAPLMPLPCPALGCTSPITVAGALAQQHAELLTCFLIAACARRGAPVTYNSRICGTNLRTGISFWGGPEIGLSAACSIQLGHRLGLPVNVYGLSTSSSFLDLEFAYQRMANALLPVIAGADIISGVGSYDNVSTGDHRITVIDNEIISIVRYAATGCQVDEETLAFETMTQLIPSGGIFMASHHTVRNMRRGALWTSPKLLRQSDPPLDAMKWADMRTREILKSHQPRRLPGEILRELDEIVQRAERDLVVA